MKRKFVFLFLILIIVGLAIYYIINHITVTKSDEYMNYTPAEEVIANQSKQQYHYIS